MDSRKTLFLLLLVAAAGGVVVWDHYKGTTTADHESKRKRLLAIDAKAVTHVELIRSNQTIVLEKNGDNWDIQKPLAARAEYSVVSSILDELEFAERSRTLTGVRPAEFGLEPPHVTIKLQSKTGPVQLHIGAETPPRDAFYVSVAGQTWVGVVPKASFDRWTQTLDQLRSRAAFEFTPSSTTRLQLKGIELTKSNTWVLTRPFTARADQNKVSELLTSLENLRIVDFVSEKPEDVHTYRLDEPDREITTFAGTTAKTLLLGPSPTNDPGKVYAKLKGSDSIFTIAAEPARKFAVQINDLRDPRIVATADANTIDIVRGADKLSLRRDGHAWKIAAPLAVDADDEAIRQFLSALEAIHVKQFTADVTTDLEKYGLTNPTLTVSLPGIADVLFGSVDASNGVRYVKRTDEPFIFGVATNAADVIPAQYGALRSRAIFNFKPDQITKLTVGEVTLGRDDAGLWKLIVPSQGILDVAAAHAVAGVVAGLRAETFGRPKTDADGALPPVVKFTAGNTTHWLVNTPDGVSAADGAELTFQLPAPIIETLSKKLVNEAKP